MTWEYLVLEIYGRQGEFIGVGGLKERLNILGAAGWEVCGITGNNTHIVVLKRLSDACASRALPDVAAVAPAPLPPPAAPPPPRP